MTMIRSVTRVLSSMETSDGAGVRLRRAFGRDEAKELDPFLLLDHFGSNAPSEFRPGFPLHPHRGIETVTYILAGEIHHRDSSGNTGVVNVGDVQWMTAGRGVMHEEMPQGKILNGFQLWVNLPRAMKMMAPRYNNILANDIGIARPSEGCEVKVIAGKFGGVEGPMRDLTIQVELFDVHMGPGAAFEHKVKAGINCFAYVYEGRPTFGPDPGRVGLDEHTVLFGEGDTIVAKAGRGAARFLFASGRPLREPIAWGGPVVMNTDAEVEQAFKEIDQGIFIREED
ncbi:MAG: Pirin [Methanomassiliicoccales archaeon PtaU1.Bin124]|nr:MAG: Pirin [Methanomassiliicoccales archaeon PtaU1.Bin124]